MDEKTRDMIWFFEFMPKFMRKKKRKRKEDTAKCKICGNTRMVDHQGLCEECRQRYGRMAGIP